MTGDMFEWFCILLITAGVLLTGYVMGVFAERRAVRRRLAHYTMHELLMALRDRTREHVKNYEEGRA